MKNFSLKRKIYFVGLIPFCFYSILIINSINENYSSYKETQSLESKINVVEAASSVVHETQIERGKSASFLSGGATLENLKKQRIINNEKHIILKEKIENSSFSSEYKDELLSELAKYDSLRSRVTKKEIKVSEALKLYTSIVKRFLRIELDLASSSTFPTVAARLKGYRILEDAKESGGKLRANMSSILAKNTKISDGKFLQIINLKAGVDANLNSSGLIIDEKTRTVISEFKSSKEWNIVNDTFQLILLKSKVGSYNKNSVQFFKDITIALNIIGSLVIYQKDELLKEIVIIKNESLSNLLIGAVSSVFLAILLFLFISSMTGSITKKIKSIIEGLIASTNKVSKSTEKIELTSSKLKDSSSEQAASLQQTVSSVHQISSMVEKNFEASKESVKVSEESRNRAGLGKKNMNEVTSAIDLISQSNMEIFEEMKFSNDEISKITSLILEIEDKTKVINDIVFQTKLLSFNASVEAARAGEHGKGFSVVAEEIGNLATMSGQAAEEISNILTSSIDFVNETVERSKSKIENLVTTGQGNIKRGKVVVDKCSKTLDEILKNVDNVNTMISQISISTNEQASGINEVKKAIEQLDKLTLSNDTSAKVSSEMALSLKSSTLNLNESVKALLLLVDGQKQLAASL